MARPGRTVGYICAALFVTFAMLPAAGASNSGTFPKEQWSRLVHVAEADGAGGVAVGRDGSVYVTGNTQGPSQPRIVLAKYGEDGGRDFLDASVRGVGSAVVASSSNEIYITGPTGYDVPNILVEKRHGGGGVVWRKLFQAPLRDGGRDLEWLPNGDIVVVGETGGPRFMGREVHGDADIFVMRLSPTGTVRWVGLYGTRRFDQARGVAVTGGRIYVTGFENGNDAVLLALTGSGRILWHRKISDRASVGNDIAARRGVLYVVGQVRRQHLFEGGEDAFVAAFDVEGKELWRTVLGDRGRRDAGTGITVARDGRVVVSGISGSTSFDGPRVREEAALLATLDARGKVLTAQRITGEAPGYTYGQAVAVRGSAIYLVGQTLCSTFHGNRNGGGVDIFVMKLAM